MISNLLLTPLATYSKNSGLKFRSTHLSEIKTRFIALNYDQKYEFYRLLYINLQSGVTMDDALGTIKDATGFKNVSLMSKTILRDLGTGIEFWRAIELFPRTFNDKDIGLIKTGEETGKMNEILQKLMEDIERIKQIKGEIKAAMIMPGITFVVTIGAVFVLLTQVMPTFVKSFKESGNELPLVTRVVIALSDFLVAYPWAVLVFFFVLWGVSRLGSFGRGMKLKHKLTLNLGPITKQFILLYELSNFITTMELMISSGIDIVESTKKSQKSVTNVYLKEEVDKMILLLERGAGFGLAIGQFKYKDEKTLKMKSNSRLMDLTVISVLQVGEEQGYLTDVLKTQKRLTNNQILANIKQVSKIVEPLMVLMIAAFVLPIILAIIMPYFEQIKIMIEGVES